jgi:hypothetical protein
MPAIDRNRLMRELEGLTKSLDDPVAFRWKFLNLLEFYADRTRRPGPKRLSEETSSLGVPAPVLDLAIQSVVAQIPDLRPELVRVLWDSGVREARLLAIALALKGTPEQIRSQFEAWAQESDDPDVHTALASRGYPHWLAEDKKSLDAKLANWLGGRSSKMQRFGLEMMRWAVSDPTFDSLPAIFEWLENLQFIDRGSNRRALKAVFVVLIERNPGETAGYLLGSDQISTLKWLIRDLQSLFPAPERERIRQILSS